MSGNHKNILVLGSREFTFSRNLGFPTLLEGQCSIQAELREPTPTMKMRYLKSFYRKILSDFLEIIYLCLILTRVYIKFFILLEIYYNYIFRIIKNHKEIFIKSCATSEFLKYFFASCSTFFSSLSYLWLR